MCKERENEMQQEYKLCLDGWFYFWELIPHLSYRTQKASPPITSRRLCWLFLHATPVMCSGGCGVNLLPGLAWKTHLYAGSYCLQQHGCCLPLSFQVSPASSSPSSFLLPKWEASAMSGGDRSCKHPVNKLFVWPQPCLPKCDESFHGISNETAHTHTHKIMSSQKIRQNFSTSDWRPSKVLSQ